MLNTKLKQEIRQHAFKNKDKEVCGLIIDNNGIKQTFPCDNVSQDDHSNSFLINPKNFIAASRNGDIKGFYHSHPDEEPILSDADKNNAKQHNLHSIVYSVKSNKFIEYHPEFTKVNYIGRYLEINKNDCYSLVRDYYQNELGINLPNFDRSGGEWYKKVPKDILNNFKELGFKEVNYENKEKHDLLIFKHPKYKTLCDFSIYLGSNYILCFLLNNYSTLAQLNKYSQNKVGLVLRYNGTN